MQDGLTELKMCLGELKEAQAENEKRMGIMIFTFDDFIRRSGDTRA